MTKQKETVSKVMKKMQKIKVTDVLAKTGDLFITNPLYFIVIPLVQYLIVGLLGIYAYPPMVDAIANGNPIALGIGLLIVALISMAIYLFGFGMLVKVTDWSENGKKINIQKALDFVRKYYIDGLKLVVEIIKYNGAWMFLVYAALSLVFPVLLALMPIAIVIYIIVFFRKLMETVMALYIFFSAEKPNVEEALKESIKKADELIWSIFANLVFMGVISGVAWWILTILLSSLLRPMGIIPGGMYYGYGLGGGWASILASAIICSFSTIYVYKLKEIISKR